MELEELKREKKILEEKISKIIAEFQQKYSVSISSIDLVSDTYRTTSGLYNRD